MSSAPLRIAFVTGGLPFGGSTTFLLYLCAGLRAAGVSAEVFSLTRANPLNDEFIRAKIPVHLCDENRWILEDRLVQTHAALAHFKPVVVVANIGWDAYEMLVHVPSGVARVGVVHDRSMRPEELLPTYQDVLDHVVVVAKYLTADVAAVAPQIPCTHLLHGVNIPPTLTARNPNPREPLKLIYFGRITTSKGARRIPPIIDLLNRAQIPFRWTIHGEGEEKAWLQTRLTLEVLAGKVVFSAPVAREELLSLVRQHDIYFLASDFEGGPQTLLEGMGLGLVPICGDIPGLVQEVITPEIGFCVPRESAEAFFTAIAQLHADRQALETMSAHARRAFSSDFTEAALARRYLVLFSQLNKFSENQVTWPHSLRLGKIRALRRQWHTHPAFRFLRRLAKWTSS